LARCVAQFGKEGLKIVMIKSFVNWINAKMVSLVGGTKDQLGPWYDVHLMRVAHSQEDELNAFDEAHDMLNDDVDDMADGGTNGLDVDI
jgi:hypothetical protein